MKMNTVIRKFLGHGVANAALVAVALSASSARAGYVEGVVSWVETNASDGYAYVTVEGTYVSRPACSTFLRQRFEIDTTQVGGRNSLAVALSAKVGGGTVFAYGTGECRSGGVDERLQFIGLHP